MTAAEDLIKILQDECAALAVENAGLREALRKIYAYRSDEPDWNMVMAIAGDALEADV